MGKQMRTYEGMFLVDPTDDFEQACQPVREVLERAEAEIITIKPWDERRLAYKIKGRKRGLYILTYFRAKPEKIAPLQYEIQINERLLRALILLAEHVTEEQMHADTPATLAAKAQQEVQEQAEPQDEEQTQQQEPTEEQQDELTEQQEVDEQLSTQPEGAAESAQEEEPGQEEKPKQEEGPKQQE